MILCSFLQVTKIAKGWEFSGYGTRDYSNYIHVLTLAYASFVPWISLSSVACVVKSGTHDMCEVKLNSSCTFLSLDLLGWQSLLRPLQQDLKAWPSPAGSWTKGFKQHSTVIPEARCESTTVQSKEKQVRYEKKLPRGWTSAKPSATSGS